jgi:hypothetical protein
MWHHVFFLLRRQPGKSTLVSSGFLLAACALILLSATTQTTVVQANQIISQNWRSSYDIVVLPPQAHIPSKQIIPGDLMEGYVQPGDHVVINWQAKCGQCRRCVSGRPDLCEDIQATKGPRVFWRDTPIAVLLQSGTFCLYVVVPALGAVPIRRDLPLEHAALLGCAVATGVGAALFTAQVQPGEDVVVLGTGGVGLNIVQGARLANAHRIIAVDVDDDRLAIATACGATHTQQRQVSRKELVPPITTFEYVKFCQALYIGDYQAARRHIERKLHNLSE